MLVENERKARRIGKDRAYRQKQKSTKIHHVNDKKSERERESCKMTIFR